ncbi:MAG: LamG domain-containing protein, partial [Planctomycetes bacterium]|nr:LamG domain-containing protein [Planctomycetota bacterium]
MEMTRQVKIGVVVLVFLAGMVSEVLGQVEPNLIGWWKLDETSGITAADSAGSHHGTLIGDPNWISGVDNNALDFNLTYEAIHVPHHPDLNPGTGPFTLTAWIRNENTPGSQYKRIITKRGDNLTPSFYSMFLYDNKLRVELMENFPSEIVTFSAGPAIQGDGLWHHVACVRDEPNDVYLYMDGVQYFVGVSTEDLSNGDMVKFGTFWSEADGGETFKGRMDDLRIYKAALAEQRIKQLAGFAEAPTPSDGATGVSLETQLSFTPNPLAASHDVYFDMVNPPVVQLADDSTETSFDPGVLDYGQTYYWRVDENILPEKTVTGDVWQFTTLPWVGTGAELDPYQIGTVEQLQHLSDNSDYWDPNIYFELIDDITIPPDMIINPIGNDSTPFRGVFNGNDHTITGLNQSGFSNLGLFGKTSGSARISNLSLAGATIDGNYNELGILVGCNYGSISHCYAAGEVTGGDYFGGLVGVNDGTISHCSVDSPVTGNISLGGLVGL